jgi:ZIP family zinc transporter
MTLAIIAFAAFLSTLLGGLFALRLRDRLHLILGFSAGAVIGVAFFDLLPEALELGGASYEASTVLAVTALGFLVYLAVDRLFLMHGHDNEEEHHHAHGRGLVGAASLSMHSFLDGIGIGLAFQVSPAVGFVVAAAVLTHDFSDGINTVSMIVKNGGARRRAFYWLALDALAPVLGILATLLFSISDEHLGLLLALFAGFFLYIGASDLVPESHHRHPTLWTTAMTVLGAAVLFVAIRLAGV